MVYEYDDDIDYEDKKVNEYITQIKVTLNSEELKILQKGMELLRQVKPSTAIKQLCRLGVAKLDLDHEMVDFLANNYRKNTRIGICDFSREVDNALRKVPR